MPNHDKASQYDTLWKALDPEGYEKRQEAERRLLAELVAPMVNCPNCRIPMRRTSKSLLYCRRCGYADHE